MLNDERWRKSHVGESERQPALAQVPRGWVGTNLRWAQTHVGADATSTPCGGF